MCVCVLFVLLFEILLDTTLSKWMGHFPIPSLTDVRSNCVDAQKDSDVPGGPRRKPLSEGCQLRCKKAPFVLVPSTYELKMMPENALHSFPEALYIK